MRSWWSGYRRGGLEARVLVVLERTWLSDDPFPPLRREGQGRSSRATNEQRLRGDCGLGRDATNEQCLQLNAGKKVLNTIGVNVQLVQDQHFINPRRAPGRVRVFGIG